MSVSRKVVLGIAIALGVVVNLMSLAGIWIGTTNLGEFATQAANVLSPFRAEAILSQMMIFAPAVLLSVAFRRGVLYAVATAWWMIAIFLSTGVLSVMRGHEPNTLTMDWPWFIFQDLIGFSAFVALVFPAGLLVNRLDDRRRQKESR